MQESFAFLQLQTHNLTALLEHRGHPAVSIYLPSCASERVTGRLNAALDQAVQVLDEDERDLIQPQLQALQENAQENNFQSRAAAGLALFISRERSLLHFGQITPDRRVVVDDYFYVSPLMTQQSLITPFLVADLNAREPRLFRATQVHFNEQALAESPDSDPFQSLVQELHRRQGADQQPLVIASYNPDRFNALKARLEREGLGKSLSHLPEKSSAALHQQAWENLTPLLRETRQNALQGYRQIQDSAKVLEDLQAVAQAAYNSRVEKLFLLTASNGQHPPLWHSWRMEDLLNRATIYTWLNGGSIFTVQPDELPVQSRAAAILKY